MKKAIFTINGKGGVGKSVTTALLHQFLTSQGFNVIGLDIDPGQSTYAGYEGLGAEAIPMMRDGQVVSEGFDQVYFAIESAPDDSIVLIDTGSKAYLELLDYIEKNEIFDAIRAIDTEPYLNIVVPSGPELFDAMQSVAEIMDKTDNQHVPAFIWLNDYSENMPEDDSDPRKLINKAYSDRVAGFIHPPQRRNQAFADNFSQMLTWRLTFGEYQIDPRANAMTRNRVSKVKRDVFETLADSLSGSILDKAADSVEHANT